MLKPQDALVWTMVLVSAADRNMTDRELKLMGEVVANLPIFSGFASERITAVARDCPAILDQEDGLDTALDLIRASLPPRLRETAYALACDVAAADGRALPEEMRVLELLRHRLDLDRLVSAGIERGARARWQRA